MSKLLSVPLKQQPPGSNACWLMCAIMLSDYYNGPGLKAAEILNHFQLKGDVTGCGAMTAMFLESEFQLSYTDVGTDPGSYLKYIDHNVPICLGFARPGGGHAVLLVGYVNSGGKITFLLNDPAEKAMRSVKDLSNYDGMILATAYAIGENRFS